MVCEKCGERMRVKNSRPVGKNKREREHRCPKCGYRMFTTEQQI